MYDKWWINEYVSIQSGDVNYGVVFVWTYAFDESYVHAFIS